jgi:hypothetical protein
MIREREERKKKGRETWKTSEEGWLREAKQNLLSSRH